MLVLNPLVLVLPNGDCLPFHRNARYARSTYKGSDVVGLWAGRRTCLKTVRRCIPSLLRYSVVLLPALLLEEGGLAPQFG